MKVEEELRSAILEKNLLRDSERILLNTFDTLKMHYDAKKNNINASESREEATDKNTNSSSKKEEFKCNKCVFKTNRVATLRDHTKNTHEA